MFRGPSPGPARRAQLREVGEGRPCEGAEVAVALRAHLGATIGAGHAGDAVGDASDAGLSEELDGDVLVAVDDVEAAAGVVEERRPTVACDWPPITGVLRPCR